jgi:hypothetical protein
VKNIYSFIVCFLFMKREMKHIKTDNENNIIME